LMEIYLKSVGRGGVLLLNSTPNTTGAIPEGDIKVYRAFGEAIRHRFGAALAKTGGVGATVELELGGLRKVNQSWIMEDTRGGHRIRAYVLEGHTADGHWQPLVTGISVGHKKIDVFPEATMDKLRLRITKQVGTPIVRELAAFYVEGVTAKPTAPTAAHSAPCGKWNKGDLRAKFDLTPHIKMPATYEITLVPTAGRIKIRSAKLFFNGVEMPAEDCIVKDGKLYIRQTQQVTATTKTEVLVEFEPGSAGVAKIRMVTES